MEQLDLLSSSARIKKEKKGRKEDKLRRAKPRVALKRPEHTNEVKLKKC